MAPREPSHLDPSVGDAIERAAAALGLTARRLPSGAGHDAQALAAVTPSGMIFVPSVGGVSHDPSELTHWDDVVNGANVLLGTVLQLARR
jgi:beta-ureidopropionase / N-carbamoyl-L-amino-acid hydrolase